MNTPPTAHPSRGRRRRTPVIATCAAMTMLAALLSSPSLAGAAPPAAPRAVAAPIDIGDEVAAVRADLRKTAPAIPLSEAELAGLDKLLGQAEAQAATAACETASALREYAAATGTLSAKVSASGAAELDRLGRRGHQLRARLLASLSDDEGCEGPVTVYVDPRIVPPVWQLPGLDGKTPRPVAGMVDSAGATSAFVADEVLVSTPDDGKLTEFLERWTGTVLEKFEPEAKNAPPQYLVRVVGKADPALLSENLAKLNEGKTKADSLAVSSEAALNLLALAAQEASTDGNPLQVGVNWLADPTTYADRQLFEAGTGVNGFNNTPGTPYSRNPYDWSYMNAGSVQDIGVTEAWTLLDSVGRLDNKVQMAILDQGFSPVVNDDLPGDTTMFSAVPFAGAGDIGQSAAPWHGTIVASAAAAVPGNFKGAAGPAGPVADLTFIYTGTDMFLIMMALNLSVLSGNNLINMSLANRRHWALAWTLLPFDGLTALLRATHDILIFAAAGNEGENVDRTTCLLGACWEKYFHSPCEQTGVRCVGGLQTNTLNRDPGSNYGTEDVDIFAPFAVLVGPDPQRSMPNKAYASFGTSVATPYALGVAALIWAAQPGLSSDSVETILLRNRRFSPDGTVKKKVINAFDAVRDALPATIKIQTPMNGWTLSAVTPTQFRANVFADGNGTPTVTWRLGNGTVLGTGNPISALPPPGVHTVTARATFPNTVVAIDSITVSVVNYTPVVTITNPSATSPAFGVSDPIPFHATSVDDAGPLAENQVAWFLDGATTPFATGHNPTVVTGAGVGVHTIRFRGCDNFNACAEDTVLISIELDPPNQPPLVDITNPANGAHLWVNGNDANGWYHELTLGGTAHDPEGGPLTVVWLDNGVQIATGLTPTVRLRGGCGNYGHSLTLIATDNAGNSRQDVVFVSVDLIC